MAVAILAAGCGDRPAKPNGQPEPVSYAVVADWAQPDRTLSGSETIRLRNRGPGTLGYVWLRLWPNSSTPGEADGCRNARSAVAPRGGARIVRRAIACSAVRVRLAHTLDPGDTATVGLGFRVRVPTDSAAFGRSAGIDLLTRALPVLAVRDRTGWHLNPDSAHGDPAFSLAAAWHVTLRVRPDLDVASTGVEQSNAVDQSGRRTVVAATPHARDFGIAIGRLRTRVASVDGVRVRVFSGPGGGEASADGALDDAATALRTYARWYSAYDSSELDVVLANLGLDSQELPEVVFTDTSRATLSHEIAHQWFYAMVGNDQYAEPWLDESFAAWNENELVPGTYRCDPEHPLGGYRGGLARGLAYYETHARDYGYVIYRGGACALRALERMLGRTRFLTLLRSEVARHRHGVVHTRDFLALLRKTDPAVARRWADLVGFPRTRTE